MWSVVLSGQAMGFIYTLLSCLSFPSFLFYFALLNPFLPPDALCFPIDISEVTQLSVFFLILLFLDFIFAIFILIN